MTRITNIPAAQRAIAWAKANPHKVISGALAETDDGRRVSTMHPDATCFCLVGRMAYEMGVDTTSVTKGLKSFVADYDPEGIDEADELWEDNDNGVHANDPLRGFRRLEDMLPPDA